MNEDMRKFGHLLRQKKDMQVTLSNARNEMEFITLYTDMAKSEGLFISTEEAKSLVERLKQKNRTLSTEELDAIVGSNFLFLRLEF